MTVGNFYGTDAELSSDDREGHQPSAAVHARVITFHVDSERVEEMKDSMNRALMRFQRHPDFRGMICLERGEDRHEVVAITLWAGSGLEETEHDAERTRKRIAATTDLGVSTKSYNVFGTTAEP